VIVRWLTLAISPYGIVPSLTVALAVPAFVYLGLTGDSSFRAAVSDTQLVIAAVVSTVVALSAWWGGHRYGLRVACVRRRERLQAYLADPELG
jgi:hypothetical protein